MTNKIVLKDGTTLIGVSGIVISKLDDSIFINSAFQIEEGTSGSLAFYHLDGACTLHSTGDECVWDHRSATLTVSNLTTKNLTTEQVISEQVTTIDLTARNLTSHYLTIEDLVNTKATIDNLATTNLVSSNLISDRLTVADLTNTNATIKNLTTTNSANTHLRARYFNIQSKTIKSSIGTKWDLEGDVAIDKNFICYCTKDYDGVSNIWKRSELKPW